MKYAWLLLLILLVASCAPGGDKTTPAFTSMPTFTASFTPSLTMTLTTTFTPSSTFTFTPTSTFTQPPTFTPTRIYIPPTFTPSAENQPVCTPTHLFCGDPTTVVSGALICDHLDIFTLANVFGERCAADPSLLDQQGWVCELYTCYVPCGGTYPAVFRCTSDGNP